jgi:hypothetical protein
MVAGHINFPRDTQGEKNAAEMSVQASVSRPRRLAASEAVQNDGIGCFGDIVFGMFYCWSSLVSGLQKAILISN